MTATLEPPTELSVIGSLSDKEKAALEKMESVIKESEIAMSANGGKITKAFAMAQGIQTMRGLITDEMMNKYIIPLMNTRLGFKTDKDPNRKVRDKNGDYKSTTPYPIAVVKDCVIETLLRGGQIVGNEMNIISGQAYFTKEFFQRALGSLPGVTNIVASPGLPQIEGNKARIRYGLAWRVNGEADCLKDAEGKPGRVLEIKCDGFSSTDQIIGKADRKAYAAAYRQITGSELAPQDGEVGDMVDGQVVDTQPKSGAESLTDKLKNRATPPATSPPAPASTANDSQPGSAKDDSTSPQESDTAQGQADEADGQPGQEPESPLPPCPETHEGLVDLVSEKTGLSLTDAEKALNVAIPKPWPQFKTRAQWWQRFCRGEIADLPLS